MLASLLGLLLLGSLINGQFLDSNEVRGNRGWLREQLSELHELQGKRAGTAFNTLNTTSSDLMLHRAPVIERPSSFASPRPPRPLLYLNTTNPHPLTVPIRDIVDVYAFGANKTIPTMMPGQESALPMPRVPRRPMSTYCQYQDCTTAGDISRVIGARLLRLYEQSPIGVMQNSISSATSALHVSTTQKSLSLRHLVDTDTDTGVQSIILSVHAMLSVCLT